MADQSNFLLNLSVLFRNTQKYFDRALVPYEIGSGQLIFLLCINENEGITMQEVTNLSEVDKGTTTKSIKRLIDQGYVQIKLDDNDKRIKRLYTTQKASEIMNEIYEYRAQLRNSLAQDMDFSAFEEMLAQASDNARNENLYDSGLLSLKIGGMQKMTLIDYPGKMAAIIFMSGCNFKCPYCHNRDLVYTPENYEYVDSEEVLDYLEKRSNVLDGVCVSGGEPLMQDDLERFIRRIRKLGYAVKLDTNGFYPDKLKNLVEKKIVDYVALDIKNTKEKYGETIGTATDSFDVKPIEKSLKYLKNSKVEFEVRTTVVKEFHTLDDLKAIAKWVGPVDHFYLQQFEDNGNTIQEGLHAYSKEEMEGFLKEIQKLIPSAELRGIKEA